MNSTRLQSLDVVDGEVADEDVSDALIAAGWIRTGVGEMAILIAVVVGGAVGSGGGGASTVTAATWAIGELMLHAPNNKLRQSTVGQGMVV